MTDDSAPVQPGVVATKVRIPDAPSMGLDRLDGRLDAVWNHRLGLIVAPAGSGKTSLLARFAARATGPVGWYRAEGWDSTEAALVRHLEAALGPVLPGVPARWQSVADVANALAGWDGAPILLVIDDLHELDGTAAEGALERLVEYAPPKLTIVAASRVPPRFNLPRLRVSDAVLELTGDDLRFRAWEVERLFRDYYEEPLPPEDLAKLARRTEGWAAGLQLFHLATRGRPPEERRRLLGELGSSSRLARELRDYLARNVLDQLPPDLRGFLVETSVLGRLSAPVCDRLLGRSDSGEILEDLERRRLFTHRLPEDGCYRYHEVLRSHLQATLLEQVGTAGLRDRFRTAGTLLMEAGAVAEAVEASCRGEDWEHVNRLLGRNGREMAEGPSTWLDAIPAAIVTNDPWLLLATARRLRSEGRLREAVESYRRAETVFGLSDAEAMCRAERLGVERWIDAAVPGPNLQATTSGARSEAHDPFLLLRLAVSRDPMTASRAAGRGPGSDRVLVAGLAALAAGQVATARSELLHASELPDLGRLGELIAALGAGVAGLLMGQGHAAVEIEGAVGASEEAGVEWLARVGRASLAISGSEDAIREARTLGAAARRSGDHWGEALASLAAAWGEATAGSATTDADALVGLFRRLGSGTFEAWAQALAALAAARADDPQSPELAAAAEATSRSAAVPAGLLLSAAARVISASTGDAEDSEPREPEARSAEAQGDIDAQLAELREELASRSRETGLLAPIDRRAVPGVPPDRHRAAAAMLANTVRLAPLPRAAVDLGAHRPGARVRLLGGFAFVLADSAVDLSGVRPRARALLRLLALHAGTAVHRETIEAALWPDADPEASSRNLHVAIAALRRALEPTAGRGSFQVLRRDGDAYRLALPADADVDLIRFDEALAAGRTALDRGDATAAERAFGEAIELYRGELLPEDGPAEWVEGRREACRLGAVEAAQHVAEIRLARGDADGAASAATAGLRLERYHDPLWRILIRARDEAGDQGAASRARSSYDQMLAELGVSSAP
ncbi:MAG TPA: BTAD domain-containing putative transcriptional regulator [Candidatus Limnocylindrales bacterium]|nr:BTAD domain-containing putative transcriptional regulator [Candidatus Limnocylindrales bacterium]